MRLRPQILRVLKTLTIVMVAFMILASDGFRWVHPGFHVVSLEAEPKYLVQLLNLKTHNVKAVIGTR
jgi:hypothetical protein